VGFVHQPLFKVRDALPLLTHVILLTFIYI
jgi:hypothetical protein